MPLALVALAAMLFIIGVTGNYATAGALVEDDVLGNPGPGFLQFMIGIIGIGAFFRLIGMPNAGRVFLMLVILVYLMKNTNTIAALENVAAGSSTSPSTGSGQAPSTGSGQVPSSGSGQAPSSGSAGAPLN